MGDFGELGPLDVQLGKSDELFEYSSGMIIDSALNSLESRAMSMFEKYFMQIKLRSSDRITFRTATQIASNMVVSLLSPVYGQIDPIKIGENAREMSVASDYGTRLNQHSQNLKSRRSLSALVESYCSHGFVIDRKEAGEIFKNVSAPESDLAALETELGDDALVPAEVVYCGFFCPNLSKLVTEKTMNEDVLHRLLPSRSREKMPESLEQILEEQLRRTPRLPSRDRGGVSSIKEPDGYSIIGRSDTKKIRQK